MPEDMYNEWQRPVDSPSVAARTKIHVDDVPWIDYRDAEGNITHVVRLKALTSEDSDLAFMRFSFPPNHVEKVHWHPADTIYIVQSGQFIVEGEGVFEAGDVRWAKAGVAYGPEKAGPEGCEVYLIAQGSFPPPTYDPEVDPPPSA